MAALNGFYLVAPLAYHFIGFKITSLNLQGFLLRECPEEFQQLECLQDLNLRRNQLTTIPYISTLTALDISFNCIEKLSALATSLQSLCASGNNLGKIEGLEHCTELRTLRLQHNNIQKIEGLENCKKLRILDLALNPIEALEGVQQCELLEVLDLSFVKNSKKIRGLEDLRQWKHLRRVEITSCGQEQLPLFPDSIQVIWAGHNPITTWQCPPDSTQEIYLNNTKIINIDRFPANIEIFEMQNIEPTLLPRAMPQSLRRLMVKPHAFYSFQHLNDLLPRTLESFGCKVVITCSKAAIEMSTFVNSGRRKKHFIMLEFVSCAFY